MITIRIDDLPSSAISHELVGEEHGGAGVCILFVDASPGEGPRLHKHPYEEVFIVQAGEATFTVGDETIDAAAGDILVAPAGAPHKFVVNTEDYRSVNIHPVARMQTEWLE
jgi:quercetin dioxygenase-like cupin family protein